MFQKLKRLFPDPPSLHSSTTEVKNSEETTGGEGEQINRECRSSINNMNIAVII